MTDKTDEQEARDLKAQIATAVASRKQRVSKKAWRPLDPATLAHGRVLSFDQTATKTGWSLVVNDWDGLCVREGSVLVPTADRSLTSFEATLAKAMSMASGIGQIVFALTGSYDVIVHEMPAVVGYRIESSLLGALGVRLAAQQHARGVPVAIVSYQATQALLLPAEQRGKKANMSAVVNGLIPEDRRRTKRWSQDVHDSVANAIYHLYREGSP